MPLERFRSQAGYIFATTNNPDYLIKVNPVNGHLTPVVGTGTSGYNGNADNSGAPLPGDQAQIDHPEGVAVARNGDVVFADTGNDLIRAYVPSTGELTDPLGGVVLNSTPQRGYNGDGHYANHTTLNHPEAIAVTNGPLLVVADTQNRRIRQLGPYPITEGAALKDPAR